jgi:uncharacterized membrane protein YvbJ
MFCNNCGEETPDGAKFCHICGSKLQEIKKQIRNRVIPEQAKTEGKEITLYSDNKGVKITNTRAIFRNKTYVMTNISSISIGYKKPNWLPAIVVLLFGMACLFISPFLGFIVLIIGCVIFYFTKGEYSVRITSASGETDAFSDKDKEYIQNIVTAINEAIIHRG